MSAEYIPPALIFGAIAAVVLAVLIYLARNP